MKTILCKLYMYILLFKHLKAFSQALKLQYFHVYGYYTWKKMVHVQCIYKGMRNSWHLPNLDYAYK